MDGPLLIAFVDRWRPETHTFHLPCGEMTVTLQDMAMILALPLEGVAATGIVQSDGWGDMVENMIGIRPPAPPEGVRDRKTSGVSSAWLRANFSHCSPAAAAEVVERYALYGCGTCLPASFSQMVRATQYRGWFCQYLDKYGTTLASTAGAPRHLHGYIGSFAMVAGVVGLIQT